MEKSYLTIYFIKIPALGRTGSEVFSSWFSTSSPSSLSSVQCLLATCGSSDVPISVVSPLADDITE